jgi:hypothetical protein
MLDTPQSAMKQSLTEIGTLRTFDSSAKTARQIAREHDREDLARLLEPRFYHHLAASMLEVIERKLHELMREYAGQYVRILANGVASTSNASILAR